MPSSSSSLVRRMRRSLVAACLASSTQQMNSFRARGVMSFQATRALGLAMSSRRRSTGSLCTAPPGSRGLLMASNGTAQGPTTSVHRTPPTGGPDLLRLPPGPGGEGSGMGEARLFPFGKVGRPAHRGPLLGLSGALHRGPVGCVHGAGSEQ